MPDQVVTEHQFAVRCGVRNELVSAGDVELTLGWFAGLPLHAVLRCDLAKIRIDHLNVLADDQSVFVRCCADVLLAVCLKEEVDAGPGSSGG